MRIKNTVTATLLALSAALAPPLARGMDLSFLGQAPLRFFSDQDLRLMGDAMDQALNDAEDGESISWSNEQTGNSGTIKPLRGFSHQGLDCRRVEIINRAKKATRGDATSRVDYCKADETWRVLSVVQ